MQRTNFNKIALPFALVGALALAGCGEEDPVSYSYESIDQCKAANVFDDAYCEKSFNEARQAHLQKAPRYASVKDCEEDFGAGQCGPREGTVARNDGGSFFTPFFLGYMMAGGLSDNSPRYTPSPVYNNRSGGYKTLSGTTIPRTSMNNAKGLKISKQAFAAPAKPKVFTTGQSATRVEAAKKAERARTQTRTKSSSGFKSRGMSRS